jgi:hypothetical protein
MQRWRTAAGPLVLGLLLLTGSAARADRVPSYRTVLPPSTGVRTDLTVPYTTNGFSTLGVWQGVAPAVFAGPAFGPTGSTVAQPVYNLPYYGARQSFSTLSNGALQRPPNNLRGNE